ncbi:MYND-type domain-containing protein [Mycena chlorophos]|uniref:MYND-type domain-containing protein n=1 Tax=Mycena chlorophos TaxID=658473 RepID=A0A8H6W4L4_MYCCL|nr:MYND-type domain-containing protein [Mycena chlorophos]
MTDIPSTIRPCSRTAAAGFICRCSRISPTPMQRCSTCKRVFYCSPECQRDDWSAHKAECKQLKRVNAHDEKRGHWLADASQRLRHFQVEQALRYLVVADAVGTNPYSKYPALITFGRKCQVCFRTEFHAPEHDFTPCPKCKLAWWCSPECGAIFTDVAHTAEHCKNLSIVRTVDCFQATYAAARFPGQQLMLISVDLHPVYIPPSSLSGWEDYKMRIFPEFDFAADVTSWEFRRAVPNAAQAVDLLATESTSIVATLLSALEIAIPNLARRKSLCIHVAGAAERELETQGMGEELLHYLPKLKTLTMIYVGPDVWDNGSEGHNFACMKECRPQGRKRVSIRRTMTYHGFAQTPTFRANPPDLVAGFNTGMGEVDTVSWRKSLRIVLDRNVPAVFTAYSMGEGRDDIRLLRSMDAHFIMDLERNKWRGPIPKPREALELLPFESSHYTNNYWFMVKGHSESIASGYHHTFFDTTKLNLDNLRKFPDAFTPIAERAPGQAVSLINFLGIDADTVRNQAAASFRGLPAMEDWAPEEEGELESDSADGDGVYGGFLAEITGMEDQLDSRLR